MLRCSGGLWFGVEGHSVFRVVEDCLVFRVVVGTGFRVKRDLYGRHGPDLEEDVCFGAPTTHNHLEHSRSLDLGLRLRLQGQVVFLF